MSFLGSVVAQAKLVWDRITLSRLTLFYFIFSLSHCTVQVIFQTQAFEINSNAATLFNEIIEKANDTRRGYTALEKGNLEWCPAIRNTDHVGNCTVIWPPNTNSSDAANAVPAQIAAMNGTQSITSNTTLSTSTSTTLTGIAGSTTPATVTTTTKFVEPSSTPASHTPVTVTVTTSVSPSSQTPAAPNRVKRTKVSIFTAANDSVTVTVSDLPSGQPNITLDNTCLTALNWPLSKLDNTKREDVTFIGFNVWVLGMSLVALLNESMPHMLASLLTHMMATAWAVYQLKNTADFHQDYNRIITDGACRTSGNLIPSYWQSRRAAEIPIAVLNGAALLLSAFLTYKMIRLYNWATFRRIGANRSISRIYKLVLSLSVALQLSLFFIVVSMALWIDQLWNGAIGSLAVHGTLYRSIYIPILCLLVPWLIAGWVSARRELRVLMLFFLGFNILLLAGWASMFASSTFRLTFEQWRFFALMSVLAVTLALTTFILGILCRRNFGKNLPKYLHGSEPLSDDDDFSPSTALGNEKDLEKVDFSSFGTMPTYAPATIPVGAPRGQGNPMFIDEDGHASDDDLYVGQSGGVRPYQRPDVTVPMPVQLERVGSNGSFQSLPGERLGRTDSNGSTRSNSSGSGNYGRRGETGSGTGAHKRWVIE
ncbi:hypothetical protein SISSUDRAFT_1050474 [Sistotremastrum suecicum HHB10207 ss-3]|uniref:PalH-domain-containing protein n=1 Tax=Sistotremastrum suecicum HHB10207 ss-3 TaxID=1314776 RepID=A0A166B5S7_9AGAM|nr:hypothetical protein SISSUDRAFT_1050474 [Sistotremastrum suecicum HHB10207 ss-3]